MWEQSVLERLTEDIGRAPARPAKRGDGSLIGSIAENLARMLNTRRGSALINPDYGILDLSDLPGTMTALEIERLVRFLREQIERYEPRLTKPTITFEGALSEDLILHFSLSGTIVHTGRDIPVHLRARMAPGSSIEVKTV